MPLLVAAGVLPGDAVPGVADRFLEALPGRAGVAGLVVAAQLRLRLRPVAAAVARVGGHLPAVAVARLVLLPAPAGAAVARLPARAEARHRLVPGAAGVAAASAHTGVALADVGAIGRPRLDRVPLDVALLARDRHGHPALLGDHVLAHRDLAGLDRGLAGLQLLLAELDGSPARGGRARRSRLAVGAGLAGAVAQVVVAGMVVAVIVAGVLVV